jgi:thioredoxin 1
MRKLFYHRHRALFMALLVIATGTAFAAEGGELDNIPAKGMPTLVVLGTPTCPPCVRMKPILEKIARQYTEKAAVIPIDVGIYTEQMARFNVKAIPVEVFFNAAGREVYRHLGFMDEKSILDQFKKMGVE